MAVAVAVAVGVGSVVIVLLIILLPQSLIAGGAIVLAVLIAAGTALKWPSSTNYLLAAIVLLRGIAALLV